MGGTITSGSSTPVLPAATPLTGAGSGAGLVNAAQPAVLASPAAAVTTPAITPAVQAALDQLSAATTVLQAAIQALAGAQSTTEGGGPGASTMPGCGCGTPATSAPPAQDPTQAPLPQQGPTQTPVQGPPTTSGPVAPEAPEAPEAAGGDVRQRIVDIARQELAKGVTEDAGPDTDTGGNIVKYRGAVTGPGEDPNIAEAWCADFASWVLQQAGAPIGKDGAGEDYTVALIEWAKSVNRWQENTGQAPQPGDLVLIDWQGGEGVDHVAIVEKVENGQVHTIGGNESDGIRSASYPIGDNRMMGFVPPA